MTPGKIAQGGEDQSRRRAAQRYRFLPQAFARQLPASQQTSAYGKEGLTWAAIRSPSTPGAAATKSTAPQPIDFHGEPGGTRTHDHLIKSQMLYRLSYGLAPGNGGQHRAAPRAGQQKEASSAGFLNRRRKPTPSLALRVDGEALRQLRRHRLGDEMADIAAQPADFLDEAGRNELMLVG